MNEECTIYDIFGINKEFSKELINEAHSKLVFAYHPSYAKKEEKEEFRNKFIKIQETYKKLANISSGSNENSSPNTNVVEFIIHDINKNKIADANIEISNTMGKISKGITKTCNIGGIFLDLSNGEHTIQITKKGYVSQKLKQNISNETRAITIELLGEIDEFKGGFNNSDKAIKESNKIIKRSNEIKKRFKKPNKVNKKSFKELNKIIKKSDEIKGDFNKLDKVIKKSDEITLSGDIILSDNEQKQFKDGINIRKSIIIDGKGHKIDARNLVRIFKVHKSAKLTIKNITLTNGSADFGAAIFSFGDLTVGENSNFINNTATLQGAAIFSKGDVKVDDNSDFINNIVNKYGGAIYSGGVVTLGKNSNFINNTAMAGGVIYSYGIVNVGEDCIFTDNTAMNGAAIFSRDLVNVGENCIFTDNLAEMAGAIFSRGNVSVGDNSDFINNIANKHNAGAIFSRGNVSVGENCSFTDNTATNGGAIYALGIVRIGDGSNFTNNIAKGDGGAIYMSITGKLICKNTTVVFTNNSPNDSNKDI